MRRSGTIRRLRKLSEPDDAKTKNNISVGTTFEGHVFREPVVGEHFWIGDIRTSIVLEILDQDTFRTHNSVYRLLPPGEE